jgi:hypothetical protein
MVECIKFKIVKIKRKSKEKCSICHNPLKNPFCEIWWGNEHEGESFHHHLDISCFYEFLIECKKTPHEGDGINEAMKYLKEKYNKELIIDSLK